MGASFSSARIAGTGAGRRCRFSHESECSNSRRIARKPPGRPVVDVDRGRTTVTHALSPRKKVCVSLTAPPIWRPYGDAARIRSPSRSCSTIATQARAATRSSIAPPTGQSRSSAAPGPSPAGSPTPTDAGIQEAVKQKSFSSSPFARNRRSSPYTVGGEPLDHSPVRVHSGKKWGVRRLPTARSVMTAAEFAFCY